MTIKLLMGFHECLRTNAAHNMSTTQFLTRFPTFSYFQYFYFFPFFSKIKCANAQLLFHNYGLGQGYVVNDDMKKARVG